MIQYGVLCHQALPLYILYVKGASDILVGCQTNLHILDVICIYARSRYLRGIFWELG